MRVEKIENLPDSSKKGCIADDCKNYADKRVVYRRSDVVFRLEAYLCDLHANKLKANTSLTLEQWYANRKVTCTCGHLGINHDPEDGNCEVGPPCEKKCQRFEARDLASAALSGGSEGPRCPKCLDSNLFAYVGIGTGKTQVECGSCGAECECDELSDFAQFFRVPVEPTGPHETLECQVNRLVNFIMREIPGEPSRNEGAIDCAIRLLRAGASPVEGK